jgi:hypothetical protein
LRGFFFWSCSCSSFILMYICETSVWPLEKQKLIYQCRFHVLRKPYGEFPQVLSTQGQLMCRDADRKVDLFFCIIISLSRGGRKGLEIKKTWDRKGRVSIGRPGKAYPKKSVGIIRTENSPFSLPPCGIVFF